MTEERHASVKVYLSESLRGRFKALCALEGVSMNEVLLGFIEEWVREREVEGRSSSAQEEGRRASH